MVNKALRSAKEEQQELEALHRLDEECVYQQQAGNYLKAFDCMERALVLRRHFFGADSPEVLHACKALAEMCNLLAMSFLQQDNYAATIDLLKKAEILTKHHVSEKATTLNNLACYYRRLGKLHAAMTCLKRALELEKKLQNVRNAADTHLNICAVLSQLGKHQQALEQAQEALSILQEEFFQAKHTTMAAVEKPSSSSKKLTSADQEAGGEGDKTNASSPGQQLDRVSVMCIAYHNIGVEQEFLKDYTNSVGVGLAEQYLGVDHAITTTVRNSYLAAKRTISTKSAGSKPRQQSGAGDSSLSKSPVKSSTRLISSPRSNGSLTNTLRLPSPLSKEKQFHNIGDIPTPRSIVADVLAKGATLPPLDAKSPFKSVLSPRDPFFSPRFRFDEDNGGGGVGDAGRVSKPPGSVKKKRKEVKFQTSAPVEETTEVPTVLNNNLSAPAEELMATGVKPASQVEPPVEERNHGSPILSQGSSSDLERAALLAVNADNEPSGSSGVEYVGETSALSEIDMAQEEMQYSRLSPVDASHAVEVTIDDRTNSDLVNSGEIVAAGNESLPSEADQSLDLDPTAESELESEPSSSRQNEGALAEAVAQEGELVPSDFPVYEAFEGSDDIVAVDSTSEVAEPNGPSADLNTVNEADAPEGETWFNQQPGQAFETEATPTSSDDGVSAATELSRAASRPDETFREFEEHDKEDILGLLDESAGALHIAEIEGDSRLPSPLSKEKQFHNIGDIPTPRSIVADVLAKGATLPPLDAKSPFKSVLSPRDPFFSPRFRFDEDNGGGGVGDAGRVSKPPGSVKKKRKEVKFQTSAPVEETTEVPTVLNNNLSAPAEELMATGVKPASQVEPPVEERNHGSPILSQGSSSDLERAALLAVNADNEPSGSSGVEYVGETSALSEIDMAQEEMQYSRLSPVDASHAVEVTIDDRTNSDLVNSGEIVAAGNESLPSEADQSLDLDPTAESELESEPSSSRQNEGALAEAVAQEGELVPSEPRVD